MCLKTPCGKIETQSNSPCIAGRQFTQARQSLKLIQSAVNPYTREAEMLEGMTESEDQAYATIKTETSEWTKEIALLKELDTAFGRGGIQSFALEGVLGELQVRSMTKPLS